MSQKFVMLFLVSKTKIVTLDVAAKILIEGSQNVLDHSKFKSKHPHLNPPRWPREGGIHTVMFLPLKVKEQWFFGEVHSFLHPRILGAVRGKLVTC